MASILLRWVRHARILKRQPLLMLRFAILAIVAHTCSDCQYLELVMLCLLCLTHHRETLSISFLALLLNIRQLNTLPLLLFERRVGAK